MSEELISVIIPVYNRKKMMEECIRSVMNQTYRNLEILVINGSMGMEITNILKTLSKEDDRIRVIRVCPSIYNGAPVKRNLGLDQFKGQYVAFLDSDDKVEPECYEKLLKALQEHPSSQFAQCGYHYFDQNGNVWNGLTSYEGRVYSGRELCELSARFVGLAGPNIMIWNKLYRREVFDSRRFKEIPSFEDMSMMFELDYQQKEVPWLPDLLVDWRQDIASGSRSGSYGLIYEVKANEDRLKFLEQQNDAKLYHLVLRRLYYVCAEHVFKWRYCYSDQQRADQEIRNLKKKIRKIYPELIALPEWSQKARVRMRLIRLFPMLWGRMAYFHKLDLEA